jgi:DNA-3-methyladenine glycosylase I
MNEVIRCPWAKQNPYLKAFHDTEWGEPITDSYLLHEHLVLTVFQSALGYDIVLAKREGFRLAFAEFIPERMAAFTDSDIERLLMDKSIIRNRNKITSAITNAQAWVRLARELGGDEHIHPWLLDFVGGHPLNNQWLTKAEVPKRTPESDKLALALKKRGFAWLGSIACYTFMESTGLVNDHLVGCFRHEEIAQNSLSKY